MTVMQNYRIQSIPTIMLGKPVIAGSRITVELILRKLSEGANEDQLLEMYPGLESEDIKAVLLFSEPLNSCSKPG